MSCHFSFYIQKKNFIHFFEQIPNLQILHIFFTKMCYIVSKEREVCTPVTMYYVQTSAREKNESIKKIRSTLSLTESMMIMMMTPRSSSLLFPE